MTVQSKRYGLLLVGFALPHVWLHVVSSLQAAGTLPLYMQTLYYLAMGCCLMALAIAGRHVPGARAGVMHCADTFAGGILALVAFLASAGSNPPLPLLGALLALAGCGSAWLYLRWFSFTCRSNPGDRSAAVRFVLLAFVLTAAMRLVLTVLPEALSPISLAVVACAPLASVILLWTASRAYVSPSHSQPADEARAIERGRRVRRCEAGAEVRPMGGQTAFLVELCICGLALGTLKLPVATSEYAELSLCINYVLRILVPLALLFVLDTASFGRLYRPAQGIMLVVLVLLLALSLLGGETTGVIMAQALLSLSRNFALIAVYLVALEVTYARGATPPFAFGIVRGIFDCSLGAGILAGSLAKDWWPGIESANFVLFCAGLVFLLVVNRLITYVYQYHLERGSSTFRDAGRRPDSLAAACRELGRSRDLTDREVQIMEMICRGFSKGHIAKRLALSENTVRWHSKNLYEKLGVHSKQELLELVNECPG